MTTRQWRRHRSRRSCFDPRAKTKSSWSPMLKAPGNWRWRHRGPLAATDHMREHCSTSSDQRGCRSRHRVSNSAIHWKPEASPPSREKASVVSSMRPAGSPCHDRRSAGNASADAACVPAALPSASPSAPSKSAPPPSFQMLGCRACRHCQVAPLVPRRGSFDWSLIHEFGHLRGWLDLTWREFLGTFS